MAAWQWPSDGRRTSRLRNPPHPAPRRGRGPARAASGPWTETTPRPLPPEITEGLPRFGYAGPNGIPGNTDIRGDTYVSAAWTRPRKAGRDRGKHFQEPAGRRTQPAS